MKNKIICITTIIVISIVFFITTKIIRMRSEEVKSSLPINYETENKEEKTTENNEKITEIIENQGLKADENIYEILKEYDGREVISVKSDIKYKVALAGILKKQKPDFSELNELLENAPKHTGIWISEDSRNTFLDLLGKQTNATYSINEEGFLLQKESWIMNKYDNSISEMLSDEKLHVFDISSVTYIVDEVTGEIQEYPFEEMDPHGGYEYFQSGDMEMFIVGKNSGNLPLRRMNFLSRKNVKKEGKKIFLKNI